MRFASVAIGVGALALAVAVLFAWSGPWASAPARAGDDARPPLADELRARIDAALLAHTGTPEAPKVEGGGEAFAKDLLDAGRVAWERRCTDCHGSLGWGNGYKAVLVKPAPRDFRRGVFKWRRTPIGRKPTRDDLVHAIGLPMHAEAADGAGDAERAALAAFVAWLSLRAEIAGQLERAARDAGALPDDEVEDIASFVIGDWLAAPRHAVLVERPSWWDDPRERATAAVRGKALFADAETAQCASCHGPEAKGDGPQAGKHTDVWGQPSVPYDLTAQAPRGGARPEDVYLRIACGVGGTPMPGYARSIGAKRIWDLVAFVLAARPEPAEEKPSAPDGGGERGAGSGG